MKRILASLMAATAWTGVFGVAPAYATGIELFLGGIAAGFAGSGAALGGVALTGALGAGIAVGQFLAANIGTLVLFGATLLFQALQNRQMESSQVNFRQPNAVRRHAAGIEEVGGHVGFASYDDTGAFWYMIIHCDSELMTLLQVKLDSIVIEKDVDNKVTTEEFIAEESGFLGFTSRKPFFRHWLCSFTPADPVPDMPADFLTAFPEWTADHKLAGCTVSVVCIDPIADEQDLGGVYRWRGAIGLGEPSVSIVGVWNRIPDPREEGFDPDDSSTWVESKNIALLAAWNRLRRQGFNMDPDEINWDLVADAADKCDVLIEDRYGQDAPRYEGGGLWDENRENKDVETDILAACDGMPMFDTEGKWFPKVGVWEEPTLTLTAARDILAMQDSEATDGESETDGVIVEYKEPDLDYVIQPCAPYRNPNYYVEGREPKYLTVKIPTCKNHRQAVTLAKAISTRSQPTRKIAPQTGLRGRRARRERIIAIDYDETITGSWQVVTPVELDAAGATAILGLVPIDANNWTLLEGEEGEKPVGEVIEVDTTIPDPTGVAIATVPVPGTGGAAIRLEVSFDEPARLGDVVEVQYRTVGASVWQAMDTSVVENVARSAAVTANVTYEWQYHMRRGPRSSEWIAGTDILAVIVFETETTALVARFTVAPTYARKVAVNELIRVLKLSGAWALMDAFYVLAAADSQVSRLNWITGTYDLTTAAAPTFTADRGVTPNGTTTYLDTGFNPTTAPSPKFAQDDAHMGAWHLTDLANAGATSYDVGSNNSRIVNNSSLATAVRPNGTVSGTFTENYAAYKLWSRSGASAWEYYYAGEDAGGGTDASGAINNYNLGIGRISATLFGVNQCAVFHFGSNLTADQVSAMNAALTTYLQAVGAVS